MSTNLHWHAGHNVTGYLPESDEPNAYVTWHDAMDVLVADLEYAWDGEDATDEQYLEAHTAMHGATEGEDFLVYTATNPDSDHDIPTAWWITACTEDDCLTDEDGDQS